MVHKCCVSSCGMSVRVTGSKGLSYHTFPVKEPSREKWLQAVLPHVDKPEMFRIVQGYTRICSRHFKKKDYSIDSRKRARLSSTAVPSAFPGRDIREAAQPIRIEITERHDNLNRAVTIRPAEAPYDATAAVSSEDKESVPVSLGTSADPCQLLSEDDTASSTFSSQEECYVTRHQSKGSAKRSGKVRKRRKHRAPLPVPLTSYKKRSSNGVEDLTIEVVGVALAEINLSALISSSSDVGCDAMKETGSSIFPASSFGTINVEPLFLCPAPPPKLPLNLGATSKRPFLDDEGFASRSNNSGGVTVKQDGTHSNFELELLMSIQAVRIGPSDTPDPQSPRVTTPTPAEIDSLSLEQLISSTDDDSLVSSHLHDLYADLVNGGASLSLEDSTATIFDSQLLIDALQGVAADLNGAQAIDQLAGDLDDSFLNEALASTSIGDFCIDDLSTSFPSKSNLDRTVIDAPKDLPKLDTTFYLEERHCDQELPHKRIKEESESSPDIEEISTPTRSRKKSPKKDKFGSFSVIRFRDSAKDIEYYTGFQTFEQFDAFFSSIESYVENLKVTDMVYGVANLGLSVSSEEPVSTVASTDGGSDLSPPPAGPPELEEPKRRLSQGRSMSRMDEMFMTIVRLRRKIPEKVIGHMFCISQPSVSRIIRAWTMLLSKILELTSDKSLDARDLKLPLSFRQLFHTELAQTIISSGNATLNSRKTSSSTKCSNTSRSKRPKKEKVTGPIATMVQPCSTAETSTSDPSFVDSESTESKPVTTNP